MSKSWDSDLKMSTLPVVLFPFLSKAPVSRKQPSLFFHMRISRDPSKVPPQGFLLPLHMLLHAAGSRLLQTSGSHWSLVISAIPYMSTELPEHSDHLTCGLCLWAFLITLTLPVFELLRGVYLIRPTSPICLHLHGYTRRSYELCFTYTHSAAIKAPPVREIWAHQFYNKQRIHIWTSVQAGPMTVQYIDTV